MRFLNTRTLAFVDFPHLPNEYAVLSHTWGYEEVLYQDMLSGSASGKPGWSKLKSCCERAAADSFELIWIDTCCIDKRNNVELSEAINSMFNLYENSTICYAYLQDVPPNNTKLAFHRSRWFTRGWTLQELLAPRFVVFLNQKWQLIGTKCLLAKDIAIAAGISRNDQLNYRRRSIATKMSWAARRRTALLEDEAYCLLGLFSINMPLIYGEGRKAFVRLQEELIRIYDDGSIFAWQEDPTDLRAGKI